MPNNRLNVALALSHRKKTQYIRDNKYGVLRYLIDSLTPALIFI